MESEIEIVLTKARWDERNLKERGEWSEEWQLTEIDEGNIFDHVYNTIQCRKKGATDIPTYKTITRPEWENEKFEIQARTMKAKMMNVVDKIQPE